MKRKLVDEVGPGAVHNVFAAELGLPGTTRILPTVTDENKFHSIKNILDRDEELKGTLLEFFLITFKHDLI
jgi:hypothetical protein